MEQKGLQGDQRYQQLVALANRHPGMSGPGGLQPGMQQPGMPGQPGVYPPGMQGTSANMPQQSNWHSVPPSQMQSGQHQSAGQQMMGGGPGGAGGHQMIPPQHPNMAMMRGQAPAGHHGGQSHMGQQYGQPRMPSAGHMQPQGPHTGGFQPEMSTPSSAAPHMMSQGHPNMAPGHQLPPSHMMGANQYGMHGQGMLQSQQNTHAGSMQLPNSTAPTGSGMMPQQPPTHNMPQQSGQQQMPPQASVNSQPSYPQPMSSAAMAISSQQQQSMYNQSSTAQQQSYAPTLTSSQQQTQQSAPQQGMPGSMQQPNAGEFVSCFQML